MTCQQQVWACCVFVILLASLVLAIWWLDLVRTGLAREGGGAIFDHFLDVKDLTDEGKTRMCSMASQNAKDACGESGNVLVSGKLLLTTKASSGTNPYMVEQATGIGGGDATESAGSLRITLGSNADESVQVWGGSPLVRSHLLRADGRAMHKGAVIAGAIDGAMTQWSNVEHGIHAERPDGRWSHFPWVDGTNYIRGETQVDGQVTVDGPLVSGHDELTEPVTHGLQVQRPDGRWSHFPWVDGKNYIRGDVQMDNEVTVAGPLNVGGQMSGPAVYAKDSLYSDGYVFGFNQLKTNGTICIGTTCFNEMDLRRMLGG